MKDCLLGISPASEYTELYSDAGEIPRRQSFMCLMVVQIECSVELKVRINIKDIHGLFISYFNYNKLLSFSCIIRL
jgi:hypothetical protein